MIPRHSFCGSTMLPKISVLPQKRARCLRNDGCGIELLNGYEEIFKLALILSMFRRMKTVSACSFVWVSPQAGATTLNF